MIKVVFHHSYQLLCNTQSMATRDDHVVTISYPDGTTILEHADGTRITTYYRETQVPVGDRVTDDGGK